MAQAGLLPSVSKWKAASSVTFAIRSHDLILRRIDKLLERYHRASNAHMRCFVLCDLFLVINHWIKRYKSIESLHKGDIDRPQANARARMLAISNSDRQASSAPLFLAQPPRGHVKVSGGKLNENRKRYPAVLDLFGAVVASLKMLHGPNRHGNTMTMAQLEDWVIAVTGIDMKGSGYSTDDGKHMRAFSDDELALYRVWFKNGKAFQFPWWKRAGYHDLEPADSSKGYESNVTRPGMAAPSKNYSAFVMTLDLEMYMTMHSVSRGIFHSSYTNQKPVIMAGTILIEQGVIRAVRSDSGHYRPGVREVQKFLRALSMFGISLGRIEMFDHQALSEGMADKFLVRKVPEWGFPIPDGGYEERKSE